MPRGGDEVAPRETANPGLRARAAGLLGAGVLRLLGATLRVRTVGGAYRAAAEASGRGYMYAFWHGQLLPLAYLMRGRGVTVLVSRHGDGEYITQVIHRIGYGTVRGSSTRGGYRSLVEMVRRGRSGAALAITPDGPRGPRHQVQPGAVLIAQRAGVPIVPLACSVSPAWSLSSWDRFEIPKPGARAVLGLGPQLTVPREGQGAQFVAMWGARVAAAIDAVQRATEDEMNRWTRSSDADRDAPQA